jgi:hypothetical protein
MLRENRVFYADGYLQFCLRIEMPVESGPIHKGTREMRIINDETP